MESMFCEDKAFSTKCMKLYYVHVYTYLLVSNADKLTKLQTVQQILKLV